MFVWLGRINHCRGFGIQSPTDYRFVRYVINERAPYYAYEWLGIGQTWYQRKLGLLYFRLVNERQPSVVVDRVGMADYLKAGCKKCTLTDKIDGKVQMAIVSIEDDIPTLFNNCDEHSMVIIQDIWRHKSLWRKVVKDHRTVVSFDLYYCGVVLFDQHQSKKNYIVNF